MKNTSPDGANPSSPIVSLIASAATWKMYLFRAVSLVCKSLIKIHFRANCNNSHIPNDLLALTTDSLN